jgi:hypothetical protein
MIFIQPGAAGIRKAPRAVLRREAGAEKKTKKSSEALFSELLGSTVFIWPGAARTRGALGVVLRWEAGVGPQGTRASPSATLSWEVGTCNTLNNNNKVGRRYHATRQ